MFTKRRAVIMAGFAVLFLSGLLLTAFGGTPAPPYVHERVVVLGETGSIIEGQVGEIIDVQLGDLIAAHTSWRFTQSGTSVRVTPVFAASMPDVTPLRPGSGMPDTGPPPSGSEGQQTASAGGTVFVAWTGASPSPSPSSPASSAVSPAPSASPVFDGPVQMVRLTLLSTGVTTVRGWRVPIGGNIPDDLPDFVFIVLVKR
jgi:hypothetical protein